MQKVRTYYEFQRQVGKKLDLPSKHIIHKNDNYSVVAITPLSTTTATASTSKATTTRQQHNTSLDGENNHIRETQTTMPQL